VGFEGARDRVIVVPKKINMTLWLFGDDASAAIDRAYETFMLTPIFLVSGLLSNAGLVVALLLGIEDTRWYWLFIVGGVWLWLVSLPHRVACLVAVAELQFLPHSVLLVCPSMHEPSISHPHTRPPLQNMLSTRSPMLIPQLLTNFDALFNIANMLAASLCLSASFSFDERAAAFLLVPLPTFVLIVLGDTTMDAVDFKLRPYAYLLAVIINMSGISCMGHSFVAHMCAISATTTTTASTLA